MLRVLYINGPNLNLLGTRETDVYGSETLMSINESIIKKADELGIKTQFQQSNSEGEIIGFIHMAKTKFDCIILNPGAYTHYSIAIRDAVAAVSIPAIELHISNVYAREEFRKNSVIAPVCAGQISGLGIKGYIIALYAVKEMFEV